MNPPGLISFLWLRAAWLLFALALLLRLGWIGAYWWQQGAAFKYDDERLHWELAANLSHGLGLVSDDGRFAARMPLYPLMLAPFARAGAVGVLAARVFQAFLGAGVVLIAHRLARRTGGRRAGALAGLLVAVDPFGIFFANLLLTEVPFTAIAVLLTACARRVSEENAAGRERQWPRPRFSSWAEHGLALLSGAAILTRPSAVPWIAALWGLVWLWDTNRWRGTRRLVRQAFFVGVLLLPWGVRNYCVLGHFAWLSANGGVTLYDAQGPQARGDSDQSFLHDMPELNALGEVERDEALRRLAIEHMRQDPVRVLRLAGVKFLRTWNPFPNVEEYRAGAAAWASAVYTLGVVLLAVVSLVRPRRMFFRAPPPAAHSMGSRRLMGSGHSMGGGRLAYGVSYKAGLRSVRRLGALLWLPVVVFTLLHCIYVGSVRYRVPLMPFLAIAAGGVVRRRRAALEQKLV